MKLIYIACGVITLGILSITIYFHQSSSPQQVISMLKPANKSVVESGQSIYVQNCASCHGVNLEGQANWRSPLANGTMPAPPHDETGHTWHHSDNYLFMMTKYGIEKTIGRSYPNNMPAYEDQLSDQDIIAVLSYIKSQWSESIQRQHDQINARASEYN